MKLEESPEQTFLKERPVAERSLLLRAFSGLWGFAVWRSMPAVAAHGKGGHLAAMGRTWIGVLRSLWRRLFRAATPEDPGLPTQLEQRTEELAGFYAGLHRSTFLTLAVLGVLAVLIGLSGAVVELSPKCFDGVLHATHLAHQLVTTELVLLTAMILLYGLHGRRRWHERSTDYRLISERLRHARALASLGLGHRPHPYRTATQYSDQDPAQSWTERVIMRVLRAEVPRAGSQLAFTPSSLGEPRAVVRGWLAEQQAYHQSNSARAEGLHTLLESIALLCIVGTFAAGLAHLKWANPWLYLPAGALPALGAACHGVAGSSEVMLLGARSKSMARKLSQLLGEFDAVQRSDTELIELSRIATAAADCMVAETGEWRVHFRLRPLPPPI